MNDTWESFIKDFCNTLYEFTKQSKWDASKDFLGLLILKLDYSPTRTCSRGGLYTGKPGINIAMHPFKGTTPSFFHPYPHTFFEYKSFEKHPIYGSFISDDIKDHIRAVVAHEYAHAFEKFQSRFLNKRTKPHGIEWKEIYKTYRTHFVNPLLPNQEEMRYNLEQFKEMAIKREIHNAFPRPEVAQHSN